MYVCYFGVVLKHELLQLNEAPPEGHLLDGDLGAGLGRVPGIVFFQEVSTGEISSDEK